MDNDTKDLYRKLIAEIEHLNRSFEAFLKMLRGPRKQHDHGPEHAEQANQHHDSSDASTFVPEYLGGRPTQAKQPDYKWYKTFDGWKKRAEFFAYLFAMAYAVITFFQWRDAHINFQKSQRPWIDISLPEEDSKSQIFVINSVGKTVDWHVSYRNSGNSPAIRVKIHSRLFISDEDDAPYTTMNWPKLQKEIEHLDLSQDFEYTLLNGDKMPNPGQSSGPIWQGLPEKIANRRVLVIVGGIIDYWDQFGDEHMTTYCVIYNPPLDYFLAGYRICPIKSKAT